MDRRRFLQWGSFLTVSVATTGLAGCGNDDAPAAPGSPAAPDATTDGTAPFAFAQGVASGDPKPDSIVLWTRVGGADGKQAVPVTLQVSATADFATLLVNTKLSALPDWDYTVRNKVTGWPRPPPTITASSPATSPARSAARAPRPPPARRWRSSSSPSSPARTGASTTGPAWRNWRHRT